MPHKQMMQIKRSLVTTLVIMMFVVGGAMGQNGSTLSGETPQSDGVTLTNTLCPVMLGNPVNPGLSVEYEGTTVFLCCPNCRKLFLEDPEPYLVNLPQFAPGGSVENADSSHGHMAPVEQDLEEIHSHDHSRDHGGPSLLGRLIQFFGKFHPLVIHFPIALLMTAVLADLIFLMTKRTVYLGIERFLLDIAALSVLAAVPMGWAAAIGAQYPDSVMEVLWQHRLLGTVAGITTVSTAVFAELASRKRRFHWTQKAQRFALYLSAALIGLTGHLGATLIYGPGYFTF